ncbi:polyketide cyclase/dehydrase and lipid transportsuperfamily protein [Striga asiatica]|uniref:Polyketide cyclase/dehydrase and lipid transportsuperfamily protein n=1 Tax=Striga asiatica TaxID=4170 RepID=A0A5A7Q9Z6_STRAF|nr:polyketide cyclase/dehydrase and lipid transportsuperfamily protein [Striga asiatica]
MIGKRIRDVLSTENDDADVVESHQDDSDDETQPTDTMDMDLEIQELQEKHIADEIYEDIEIRSTTLWEAKELLEQRSGLLRRARRKWPARGVVLVGVRWGARGGRWLESSGMAAPASRGAVGSRRKSFARERGAAGGISRRKWGAAAVTGVEVAAEGLLHERKIAKEDGGWFTAKGGFAAVVVMAPGNRRKNAAMKELSGSGDGAGKKRKLTGKNEEDDGD